MRRSRLAVLPVVLLAVLGGSAPSVPAQELPLPLPAGRLAYATAIYEAHDDGSAGIRVDGLGTMRLDGTDRRTLTSPSPAYDHTPDWSPDGRWLVSMRTQHEPTSATSTEVRITSADGSRSDVVGYGSWPTWSPDGTTIAWSSMDPDRPGVFLLTVDHSGDEVVVDPAGPRLMPTPRRTFAPSWSPLGIALAVWVQRPETEYDQDLWHLDTATGDARQLTQDVWQSFGAQRPSWHPSGLVLAVIAEEPSRPGASQAWLVRPDGSGVTRLVPEQPDLYYSWVAWAPDGLSLALQSNQTQDGVLVVSATGQVLQRLAVDELDQVTSPVWSPDGTHLFAVADDRANGFEAWKPELWAIPRAGLPPQQLTTDSSVFPFTTTAVDPGLAKRLFGPTPADTAAEVADRLPDSDTVVVAPVESAPVATPLATAVDAPILESGRDQLPAGTVDALTEDRPTTAWLVGDVSPAVETQLRALGVSTVRRATGTDASAVAADVSTHVPATTAFLAPEGSPAEQAAAAAIAGARRQPLLLTGRDALPSATKDALQRLGARHVVLTASLPSLSAAVVDELRALGLSVQRVGGATPAQAALGLARAFAPTSSMERPVVVSQGAPGVAAALQAARRGTVLLPVGRSASDPVVGFLRQHAAAVAEVEVLASPSGVTPAVETALEGAVHAGGAGTTPATPAPHTGVVDITRNACTDQVERDRFADVAPDSTFAPAIDCVAWHGLASGRTATAYEPLATVTRVQMALFVERLATSLGVQLDTRDAGFTDLAGVSAAGRAAIDGLANAGVVTGTSTSPRTYSPSGPVTRAQMAAYLNRLERVVNGAPFPAPFDAFDDDASSPLQADIDGLAAAGIVTGTGQHRTYDPARFVTRGQMAGFLARYVESVLARSAGEG